MDASHEHTGSLMPPDIPFAQRCLDHKIASRQRVFTAMIVIAFMQNLAQTY